MIRITAGVCAVSICAGIAIVYAKGPPKHEEQERQVKEAEVPKAALDALKKVAGGKTLTDFSEEVEHGITYYEGSWKGPNGNVDALVTASGDLVEIEEAIPEASAPKAVLDKARSAAGKDEKLFVEKKTVILYEVKYRKDNRRHEVVYSPDGREHEHEEELGTAADDD
ncbi:MAG: hypothetical protein DCC66_11440 [Planctomycetota bacterium]|nr:MAG: hypothetical protein DCC66_11440 [Planctomycetota bacterium]